jgi:diguanylate cyclase (GGDEF)-like protein/PAS domain S-box-containing protein
MLLILAGSVGMVIINMNRRSAPGAPWLIFLNLVVIFWGIMYLLELQAGTLAEKRIWDSFLFLSGLVAGGLSLFSYGYLTPEKRLPLRYIILLFLEPLATVILALTDQGHGLMRLNPRLVDVGWGSVIHYEVGLWIWIDLTYATLLYFIALSSIMRELLNTPRVYRKYIRIILVGMALPLFAAGIIFGGLLPGYHSDLFIGMFVFTNVCLTWAVHSERFENIIPFARDSLFRSLTHGLVVIDRQLCVVEVNEAACKLTGETASKMVGRNIHTVLPAFRPPTMDGSEVNPQEIVWQEMTLNGKELVLFLSSLLNRRQEIAGWLISLSDFTEMNRMRHSLEASEARYRSLTDHALDGIVIIQNDIVIYCNQQAAGLVGARVEDVQGHDYKRFVPAGLSLEMREYFNAQSVLKLQSRILETSVLRPDGLSVPVEVNISRIEYNHAPAVVGFIRDISKRKRIEQDLRRLETRLRNLISFSPDGVLLMDEKGTVIEWNRGMEEITGFSQAEVIGRFFPDVIFKMLPLEMRRPEVHERLSEQLVLALQTGEVKQFMTGSTEIIRADGEHRYTHQNAFSIPTERGYQMGTTTRDVTDQRRTLENLERRDAYIQAILDNSQSLMWLKDPQGTYLMVNEQQARASGRSVADILGKTDFDLWDPAVAKGYIERDRDAIESGRQIVIEEVQPTPQGDIWVETFKSPVYDRSGNLIGTIGRSIDITARKQAEKELVAGEARFRLLADTAPVMIWMSDEGATASYVNRAWLNLTGRSAADELGTGWQEMIHPDDLETLLAQFEHAREVGAGFTLEYRLRRQDGVYRWVFATIALRTAEDTTPGGFIQSCLDITEHKERENRLRLFSMAVDQAPASIVITDETGAIEYVNEQFCRVTGYTSAEVLGKNTNILKSGKTPPGDYAKLWEKINAGGEWSGVFHNRKKNGELFWEQATVFGINNDRGEIIHFMAIKEDITARREVEQTLKDKSARLEAVFNNPQIGIGLVDEHNRFVDVNHRFAEMLGYSPAEIIGSTPARFTHPDDLIDQEDQDERFLDTLINQVYMEKRFIRQDGSIFWASLSSMPVEQADGSVVTAGFVMDITERKSIAERLRSSEELYRSIIHASPDDITITDLNGTIRMVSPSALRLFGNKFAEELIGKNIGELMVVEDFERLLRPAILALGRGGQEQRIQAHGLRQDHSTFALEATMELIRSLDGKPESIVYIIRDISDRLKMEEELRRRVRELEALRATTNDLVMDLDLTRLLHAIIERLVALLEASEGEVALYDEEDEVLLVVISYLLDQDYAGIHMKLGEGAMGKAAQQRRTLVVRNYASWEGRSPQFAPVQRTILAVPLVLHDKLLGAIALGSPSETRSFNEHDARLAEMFAQQAAVAIQNARLFAEVQRLATVDSLTGVFNRRHFFDHARQELSRSLRYGSDTALIMLDVDHFKNVNDTFGHHRGDEVLCLVANICREETRDADVVGRYGGEEFVILLPETQLDGALVVAARIWQRIGAARITSEKGGIGVTASIGVTSLNGHSASLEQLLEQADQAMYRAKQAGRNRVSI